MRNTSHPKLTNQVVISSLRGLAVAAILTIVLALAVPISGFLSVAHAENTSTHAQTNTTATHMTARAEPDSHADHEQGKAYRHYVHDDGGGDEHKHHHHCHHHHDDDE